MNEENKNRLVKPVAGNESATSLHRSINRELPNTPAPSTSGRRINELLDNKNNNKDKKNNNSFFRNSSQNAGKDASSFHPVNESSEQSSQFNHFNDSPNRLNNDQTVSQDLSEDNKFDKIKNSRKENDKTLDKKIEKKISNKSGNQGNDNRLLYNPWQRQNNLPNTQNSRINEDEDNDNNIDNANKNNENKNPNNPINDDIKENIENKVKEDNNKKINPQPLSYQQKVKEKIKGVITKKIMIKLIIILLPVFLILGLLLLISSISGGITYQEMYLDTECNYNDTDVTYSCGEVTSRVSLENFVINSAYTYIKESEKEFSTEAKKALMIAIKTTALAKGNYNNTTKKISIDCTMKYTNSDDIPSADRSQLKSLYSSIANYIYVSESFRNIIVSLGNSSILSLNDNKMEQFANSDKQSYQEILKELYSPSNENNTSNIVNENTIFIGDSRMAGMRANGIVSSDNSVYRGANGYCWFSYNTTYSNGCRVLYMGGPSATNDDSALGGINLVNQKMEEGKSYNILIWLGVNDLGNIDNYFNTYKNLATNEWSNHNIYIAQVGPVNENMYSQSSYAVVNSQVENFNNTIEQKINEAGISNLIYLDLGLTQDSINWNGTDGVHYSKSDYQKIFDLINENMGTLTNDKKALYNLIDYCKLINHNSCGAGSDSGWWWPLGTECQQTANGTFCNGEPNATGYSDNIMSYRALTNAPHQGLDISAPLNSNVIAPKSGVVVSTADGYGDGNIHFNSAPCGNSVYIQHDDNFMTIYCHLQKGTILVKSGDKVIQGQKIAESGNSGRTTGPHLHFELRLNGTPMNPLMYISATDTRPGKTECIFETGKRGACLTLKSLGFSDIATAAILTNLEAESGFVTNNLENCYENGRCCTSKRGNIYGYCIHGYLIGSYGSDEAYTNGVDSGAYTNFVNDHAGYGLIQWTFSNRKQGLLNYFNELRSQGRANSIADIQVQVGYLMQEVQDYTNVINKINNSTDASDITYTFCSEFENPDGSCSTRVSQYLANNQNFVNNNCN